MGDNAFNADRRGDMTMLSVTFLSGFNRAPKIDDREVPVLSDIKCSEEV